MDRHCFDADPDPDPDLDRHQNVKSDPYPDRYQYDADPHYCLLLCVKYFL